MSADEHSNDRVMANPDKLNGWKDIAAFLGKGVRTVQRWEKDYGLPVHRIGREGGEIIYASRQELQDWFATHERRTVRDGAIDTTRGETAMPAGPAAVSVLAQPNIPGPPLLSSGRGPAQWVWAAAGIALAVLLVSAAIIYYNATRPRPVSFTVSGGVLRVLDVDEAVLWERTFEFPLSDGGYELPQQRQPGGNGFVRDLDGDGRAEVVFGASGAGRPPASAFHVFNANGSERFVVRPASRVVFGGETYSGPWLPARVFVGSNPDGRPSLYFTFTHGMYYPSALLEYDPDGRKLAEYWSNGYIESVAIAEIRGRRTLLVGAANNDQRGASLALFDGGRANGSAPALDPTYRCDQCPAGAPSAFVLFPRRCIGAIGNGTGTVPQFWVDVDGRINVYVAEGAQFPNGEQAASVWYTLSPDLSLWRTEVTSGLLVEHHRLLNTGTLNHAFGPHDIGALFPVRLWTLSTGWKTLAPGRVTGVESLPPQ